jgi:hypothetical protein
MPKTIINALGGAYDPICKMVKKRTLTPAHARIVLALRDHVQGGTIDLSGGGAMEFVQGGQADGMEAHCDRRRAGQAAWDAAKKGCGNPAEWVHVDLLIRGKITQRQACQALSTYNDRTRKRIQSAVRKSLNAAGAYLGIGC